MNQSVYSTGPATLRHGCEHPLPYLPLAIDLM
jgi:hypothetical protein